MFDLTTSGDTHSATSSPALADGALPCVWQPGPTADLSGQEAAHAKRSASPALQMAERKAKAMSAIFGRRGSPSSASVALQGSMANKLQTLFLGDGGTKSPWILRPKDTPARRLYCELMRSERTTKGKGSIGSPTPAARDGKDLSTTTAYLSQRRRHQPSLTTSLLFRGVPWQAITAFYCLAMGYPLQWNDARPRDTATRLSRKSQPTGSGAARE